MAKSSECGAPNRSLHKIPYHVSKHLGVLDFPDTYDIIGYEPRKNSQGGKTMNNMKRLLVMCLLFLLVCSRLPKDMFEAVMNNVKDRIGETALFTAIMPGNLGIARQLLQGGTDVNVKNENGHAPLHKAAFREPNCSGNTAPNSPRSRPRRCLRC